MLLARRTFARTTHAPVGLRIGDNPEDPFPNRGPSKVPAAVEHEVILPTVHTEECAPNNPNAAPMPRVDGDLGPCVREEVNISAGLKVYESKNFLAELRRTGSSRHLGCAHNSSTCPIRSELVPRARYPPRRL